MKKKQKEIFLNYEGNAWFERNHINIQKTEFGLKDLIIQAISKCLQKKPFPKKKLLEIGCGEGKRLHWISENLDLECYGVEPSEKAVALANSKDAKVIQGTADSLDFENNKFDFVVFGFCLYLCDRSDLFQIAKEADRVLKDNGYLIICDFYSTAHTKNEYHHLPGIFSFKMDYRKLFDWHPNYTCFYHEVRNHETNEAALDNKNNWVSISVIKKSLDE